MLFIEERSVVKSCKFCKFSFSERDISGFTDDPASLRLWRIEQEKRA